jgi:hypothetical protein
LVPAASWLKAVLEIVTAISDDPVAAWLSEVGEA